MYKIVLAAIALMVVPSLLDSCCGSCGCNSDFSDSFDIKNIRLLVSGDEYGTTGSNDTVKLSEVYYVNTFDVEYLKSEAKPVLLFEFNGGTQTFACDPPVPVGKQKFTSITVTSAFEFVTPDKTYPVGTDLIELFKVKRNDVKKLSELINHDLVTTEAAAYLDTTISSPQQHNFKFTFVLNNGQTYELETGVHRLLPG